MLLAMYVGHNTDLSGFLGGETNPKNVREGGLK